MAEVRKHRPRSTGSIGDQVRANIDSGPRPVTPGEPADPNYDPFVDAEAESASGVPTAAAGFAVTSLDTEGWFSFGQDAVQQFAQASRAPKPNHETDDQADDD